MMLLKLVFTFSLFLLPACGAAGEELPGGGPWVYLDAAALPAERRHVAHEALLGRYAAGYNLFVLRAIDIVQSHAMSGGGYFTGLKAVPAESPIGYPLRLFGNALLTPPRYTSYCSGAAYGVLIEALNLIFPDGAAKISPERFEAMRLQEPEGGRREDGVKYWGKWNDDGWGSNYALVQYSGMGEDVAPRDARPGDFMNISWKSGAGHSVVFLGWHVKDGRRGMFYWSSQKNTNGFSDVWCPLSSVHSVRIVRLARPENVFTFDVNKQVNNDLPGDVLETRSI